MVTKSFILLSLFNFLFSQINVKVSAEPRTIYEGDSFNLTISAENSNEMPSADISKLRDFKIVSGPSQSTNMQWINGKMSSNYSLTWTIIPKKKGQLEIPILDIKVNNKSFKSKPIKISVLDRSSASTKNNKTPDRKFFIEAKVDNLNPYRGEQITITYTLYTKTDLSGFDILELPRYQSFWTQELYSPSNLQLKESWIGNDKWYGSVVKKIALFPTKSGKIEIEPMTAVVGVREKGRRSFFFSSSKEYTVSTNSLSLDVTPLPKTNLGRSGSVGIWDITKKIKSKQVKQDEAISLLITIEGSGNIKTVDIQDIIFPRELEVFDPEINIKQNDLTDKVSGKKTIEYILIPRYSGEIIIPEINLLYFDLEQKKWVIKRTEKIYLNVSENENFNSTNTGLTKREIALLEKDIRYSDLTKSKWKNSNQTLVTKNKVLVATITILFYLLPTMLKISRARNSLGELKRNANKAYKLSIKELKDCKDAFEIYTSINNALNTFISAKEGVKKVRSNTEIIDWIKNVSKNKYNLEEIEKILKRGDAVRFASIPNEKSKNDLEKFKKIIKELDKNC